MGFFCKCFGVPGEKVVYGCFHQELIVCHCNSYVSLRKSPSTKSAVLKRVYYGSVIQKRASARNGFTKVKYGGKTGYILTKYLATSLKTYKVVKCKSYITLRKSPRTSAAALKRIPLGAKVRFEGKASNGFYKVNYGGQIGYVLSSYLKYQNTWYSTWG